MSNIANQMIAVAATLLGFVAHDALSNRGAQPTVVADVTQAQIDPVVTRSIDLDGISADWLNASPRAERAGQSGPAIPLSAGTTAARPNTSAPDRQVADVRRNARASDMTTSGFLR
ncbi:hypothetical protein [Rhizobium sp.]